MKTSNNVDAYLSSATFKNIFFRLKGLAMNLNDELNDHNELIDRNVFTN